MKYQMPSMASMVLYHCFLRDPSPMFLDWGSGFPWLPSAVVNGGEVIPLMEVCDTEPSSQWKTRNNTDRYANMMVDIDINDGHVFFSQDGILKWTPSNPPNLLDQKWFCESSNRQCLRPDDVAVMLTKGRGFIIWMLGSSVGKNVGRKKKRCLNFRGQVWLKMGICVTCFVGGVFSFVQIIDAYTSWYPLSVSEPSKQSWTPSSLHCVRCFRQSRGWLCINLPVPMCLDYPWCILRWFLEGMDFLMQVCPLG